MKKRLIIIGFAAMLLFSSCSHYTCPTYDNNSGTEKYSSGGKKTKSSKGLFPKNM